MSAALGSSTAVRALPSTLALRATPTVPSATQAYEPLVKSVLRHRLLLRIFASSAVFSWAVVALATTVRQGGLRSLGLVGLLLNPILPRTLVLAFVIWLLSAVPVVVMRKRSLTAIPTFAASPAMLFNSAVRGGTTARRLLTYVASAIMLTLVHVLTAYIFETTGGNDPRLSPFVKSKKHPYYLNGRLLYLVTSQLFIALFSTFRSIQLDRVVVRWTGAVSVNRDDETSPFMLARIVTVFATSLVFACMGIAGHGLAFVLSRSFALPIVLKLPLISRLLRPFLAHFLRGSWSLALFTRNGGLIFRAWSLGLMTFASWEFAESIFDSVVVEPVHVAHSTADAAVTLVAGINSNDTYFKHFAYDELQQFSRDESAAGIAKRTALFADQKYNPTLWATLVRETLLRLGKDYQLFLRRGAPPVPASAPITPPAQKIDPPAQVPKTPLIRKQVLKPSKSSPLRSALDTVASDGAITTALTSAAEVGASQIPELFRSVMSSHPPSVIAKAETAVAAVQAKEKDIQKRVAEAPGKWKAQVSEQLARYFPPFIRSAAKDADEWWRAERLHRVAEVSLPNRKLDGLAIDMLSSFVCASLTEDSYGVVQRDIPRILEALLSFLTAIEDYRVELISRYPPLSPEQENALTPRELSARHELMVSLSRTSDILSEVEDPLKEGVVRIVRTFGDKLSAFKFPPRTAKKLQGFVDYN
ncbi:nucleoporin protein Ndc1-Nup [Irpex rosettiformis]|uniref:Nucleoporin protein Ndc1-Nup n=1 Tax=Irpex rosettiformis TaxID=378272 RepID=A0ACB8TPD5_9APHY|nr:nucleoporin protein Ndc1-Nup [Irpex rosettiformis]